MAWIALALWLDETAELDEKTFLIGLFVIAASIGLTVYAGAVSDMWNTILVAHP